MDINKEFSNYGRRLEQFAQWFEEKTERDGGKKGSEEHRLFVR